jgi:hypothetical protein
MLLIPSDRRYGSVLRAGIFWELPLGMLQIASQNSPTKQQKLIGLARGARPPFGADQKHSAFIRSIRVDPPS